jgi:O-succinylbenzoate synthase
MRLDEVTLFEVAMRLKTPFRSSTHIADDLRHVLVRARSGDVIGWGECAAPNDPFYLGETASSSWSVLVEFLVPAVIGKSFATVEEFLLAYAKVKGNTFARAGLEMAAWDLFGRAEGCSIASMLGGTRAEVFAGISLGIDEPARLCDRIAQHLDEGYRRVKIKIAPGRELELVKAVRHWFPDLPLMVDANSSYTFADAEALQRLDPFALMMIEQPLAWDGLVEHAKLQRTLSTRICLDESIRSVLQAREALELGSCRVVNVKVGRLGGLLESKRVHDLCLANGIPVWCGGMHEYGVGRAVNIALASLPGFSLPGDVAGSDMYFDEDLVEPPIRSVNGALTVPTEPGLGFTVIEEHVRARALRAETFTA